MKRRIVCFGDSNTWGYDAATAGRFPENVRWTSRLAQQLGKEFQVVEEGLPGRTSVMDDPLFEGLNAYTYIHPCLMSHDPIELVIIMLGTNDTKERFNLTSFNIAQGITRLSLKAKQTPVNNNGKPLKILVIAPPPIGKGYYETEIARSMGKDCDVKSKELSSYLDDLLSNHGIDFLDLKGLVEMNKIDYMHLDEVGHKQLSEIIFHKIQSIL